MKFLFINSILSLPLQNRAPELNETSLPLFSMMLGELTGKAKGNTRSNIDDATLIRSFIEGLRSSQFNQDDRLGLNPLGTTINPLSLQPVGVSIHGIHASS